MREGNGRSSRDPEAAGQRASISTTASFQALKNVTLDIPRTQGHGVHRALGLRQVDAAAHLQPHVRAVPRAARRGRDPAWTARTCSPRKQDVSLIRAKIGMVFQKPTPFPMSIYDNIAFGVRLFENLTRARDGRARRVGADARRRSGTRSRTSSTRAARACRAASSSACASRAASRSSRRCCCSTSRARRSIRFRPRKIEELIHELKHDYTVVIVTHNMQQAARVSDYTAYMYLGELIEFDVTDTIFIKPKQQADRGLHHRTVRLNRPERSPWTAEHISKQYDSRPRDHCARACCEMGGLVESQILAAIEAFSTGDARAARRR